MSPLEELVEQVQHLRHFVDSYTSREDYDLVETRVLGMLAELGADRDRLDWMQRHYAQFVSSSWTADRPLGDDEVTVAWTSMVRANWPHDRTTTVRPNWRAALDAARREAEAEEAADAARSAPTERVADA
jgi:hypothetical protein